MRCISIAFKFLGLASVLLTAAIFMLVPGHLSAEMTGVDAESLMTIFDRPNSGDPNYDPKALVASIDGDRVVWVQEEYRNANPTGCGPEDVVCDEVGIKIVVKRISTDVTEFEWLSTILESTSTGPFRTIAIDGGRLVWGEHPPQYPDAPGLIYTVNLDGDGSIHVFEDTPQGNIYCLDLYRDKILTAEGGVYDVGVPKTDPGYFKPFDVSCSSIYRGSVVGTRTPEFPPPEGPGAEEIVLYRGIYGAAPPMPEPMDLRLAANPRNSITLERNYLAYVNQGQVVLQAFGVGPGPLGERIVAAGMIDPMFPEMSDDPSVSSRALSSNRLVFTNKGKVYLAKLATDFVLPETDSFIDPPLTTPYTGQDIAIADFNGDDMPDLAVLDSVHLVVFQNRGDGHFTQVPNCELYVGGNAVTVAAGDISGDGWPDIAVGHSGGTGDDILSVFIHNGLYSGYCFDEICSETPMSPGGASAIAVEDFDKDGRAEIVLSHGGWDIGPLSNTQTVSVFSPVCSGENDGFQRIDYGPAGGWSGTSDVKVVDFDKDGWSDIFVSNKAVGDVQVLTFDGAGGFVQTTGCSIDQPIGTFNILDMNDDTWLDVLLIDQNGMGWKCQSSGGSAPVALGVAEPMSISVGANPVSSIEGDFNHDGRLDISVGSEGQPILSIFLANGDSPVGEYFGERTGYMLGFSNFISQGIADFNGDLWPDLVVTGPEGPEGGFTSVALNKGQPDPGFIDLDFDGYSSPADLNDGDSTIYPFAPELCDMKDNNQDLVTPLIEDPNQNGTWDAGECDFCSPTCQLVCSFIAECGASWELCDGMDNNGNGQIDEDYTDLGAPCSDGQGICHVDGEMVCSSDGLSTVCSAQALPAPEDTDAVCDGLDNDCDGQSDEDFVSVPTECGMGACASVGATVCTDGEPSDTCVPGLPVPETCDGVDNDCDGSVDEGEDNLPLIEECYSGSPETLDVGVCKAGLRTCTNGTFGECVGEVLPSAEICDGLDNDCDGDIDENRVLSDFLQPVNSDGSSIFKAGRVIPIKIGVNNCAGASMPDQLVTLSVVKFMDGIAGTVEELDPESPGNANEDNLFRYSAAASHYMYNLSTKGYTGNATYRITATVQPSGPSKSVIFSLR